MISQAFETDTKTEKMYGIPTEYSVAEFDQLNDKT